MSIINVAIDGPSGAGKSTIARAVAKRAGYIYIDTGALYRTVALHSLRGQVDVQDPQAVAGMLENLRVELAFREGEQRVLLNGEDVSGLIRTPEVSRIASSVSAVPAVRAFLLDLQRDIAARNSCIMDGRDIATVVLPHADVKIFLTASAEERARRRYEELVARGEQVTLEEVLADQKQRDYNDSHRAAAPLRQAEDAVLIDTTGKSFDESVQLVEAVIREHLPQPSRPKPAAPAEAPEKQPREKVKYNFNKYTTRAFYMIAMPFTWLTCKLLYRITYVGKRNVPRKGKLIIAANHISGWDPVFVGSAMVRVIHAMAKEELFRNGFVKAVITGLNAFPVSRGSSDRRAFEYALELLRRDKVLGIFPEGTRTKDYKPGKGKSGIALIAAATGADIVPVAIYSAGKPVRAFRTHVIVEFGPVIRNEELGLTDGKKTSELRGATRLIMDRIKEMWNKIDENHAR